MVSKAKLVIYGFAMQWNGWFWSTTKFGDSWKRAPLPPSSPSEGRRGTGVLHHSNCKQTVPFTFTDVESQYLSTWEPIILPFVRTKSCEHLHKLYLALFPPVFDSLWLSLTLSGPLWLFLWLSFSLAHSGSIPGSLWLSLSLSLDFQGLAPFPPY